MKTIIITAVAFYGGLLFGWISCAVLSANASDSEWESLMEEHDGKVHQEESEWG